MNGVLVVFYSYSGVSNRAARLLASHLDWPVGEVTDAAPRAGFMGGLRCVMDSLMHRRPPIDYRGPDPSLFRTVLIVSPIWAYQMAGPMRSFIVANAGKILQFAQLTMMNSGGASNAVKEAARLFGRDPLLTAEFTSREIEDGTGTGRLLRFAQAVEDATSGKTPPPHRGWTSADSTEPIAP